MSRELLTGIFIVLSFSCLFDFPSFLWLLAHTHHLRYPSSLLAPFNARTTMLGERLIFMRWNIASLALHEVKSWVGALAAPVVHRLCRCISYQWKLECCAGVPVKYTWREPWNVFAP